MVSHLTYIPLSFEVICLLCGSQVEQVNEQQLSRGARFQIFPVDAEDCQQTF